MNPLVVAFANLELKTEEAVGPKTNSRNVKMLHPDMHQTSPDQGRVELTNRHHTVSTWLPTKNKNNIALQHFGSLSDTDANGYRVFTGAEGLYVKNQYARLVLVGGDPVVPVPEDRQYLNIVQANV